MKKKFEYENWGIILLVLIFLHFSCSLSHFSNQDNGSSNNHPGHSPGPAHSLSPADERVIHVSNDRQLALAIANLKAGDTVVLANGHYSKYLGIKKKKAPAHQAITIKAANTGKVTFKSSIKIEDSQSIIIEGLRFVDDAWAHLTINRSSQIKVANCFFDLTNVNTNQTTLRVSGNSSRIEICYNQFKNKKATTKNPYLTTEHDDNTGQAATYVHIHHNHFLNYARPDGTIISSSNSDREAIRLGTSEIQMNSTYHIVEYNLFSNCDGENEIISVKTSDNIIRYNTFRNNYGSLSLRHGDRNQVYANFFLGDGVKEGTGGIRIYGRDHKIYNNYMEGLTGKSWRMPLVIDKGDYTGNSNSNKHHQVWRATVVFNTIVNCSFGMGVGTAPKDSGSKKWNKEPRDCIIANNLISLNTSHKPVWVKDSDGMADQNSWSGNIVYNKGSGTADDPHNTHINSNPNLLFKAGLYKLQAASTNAINQATGNYSFVTHDFEGGRRSNSDIGADEYNQVGSNKVLTEEDVGPQ